MFGYVPGEVVDNNIKMLVGPLDEDPEDGFIGRYLEGKNADGIARGSEVEGRRKDGTTFPIEVAISEVRVGARQIVTAIVRDITDRRRAQALSRQYEEELEATVRERTEGLQAALAKQSELATKNAQAYEVIRRTQRELVRKERLAALGEVAAAVAHGIRNPLASIQAAAEVGREDLPEDSALSETLDDIVAEVGRLESRIRAVLDFAHPFEPRLARGNLNGFITGFADGVRKRLPETVRIHVALDPAVPAMEFDRAHMQEVLEALVVNAVEAMDGNGQVTIGSTLEHDNDTGRSVMLSVADTGSGIEASRIRRIFDLFYTSKPSGTGIGLAMAKRLVEAHGGKIEVASQPGQRTTFRARFPIRQPFTNHGA